MVTGVETGIDIKDIVLSNTSFGPQEIRRISMAISEDFAKHAVLRESVAELQSRGEQTPASAVRLGVCLYLLGRFREAISTLSQADGGAVARFYQGRAHFELGEYAGAIACYDGAKTAGYDPDICALATSEALRYNRQFDTAMNTLDQLFGPIEQTAEYLYQRGATVAAIGGYPEEVIRLYERAVETDGRHPGALFGLALENDRRGNDQVALDLYKRAASCFPTHVAALINLGILFEDTMQFERAQACYQRVLDCFPGHERARLYFKDATASCDMFYDEEAQKRNDRLSQLLNIPVTDFELSVRSRNCLQKMGVRTLGDLTRTSEAELLASKNFGETSLIEIRDMLASKGLELGQFASERIEPQPTYDVSHLSADEQAQVNRPISELNLSVRARKCMVRLGLTSIGELIRKTGDDLLECKNFGVTSLNEVRDKLNQIGLKLRGD
jgi:DNA-directed RNA polymerase subunit alpha